jgi:hypothetical protein
MATKHNLIPSGLFATPKDMDALMNWIELHSDPQEKIHCLTAAMMAWNLACKLTNPEDSNEG